MVMLLPLQIMLTGCLDDIEYTHSASDKLRIGMDTLKMDTLLSETPSSYRYFTVHNPHDKAIRIANVRLEQGVAQSPFKIDVDGVPLTADEGNEFEVLAKDSIYVFVMANVPDADRDDVVSVEDRLLFTTAAGVEQQVVLTAAGQSVITLRGVEITGNEVMSARRPYQIMDSLSVKEGATLTLGAGVRMYFAPEASLIVRGTLHVEGTVDEPVVMRGNRMGNMFDGQPYDRIPAQWGGVFFASTSTGNVIDHADIHSGTFGVYVDSAAIGSRPRLSLTNSIIHNTLYHGFETRNASVYVGNTQLTNAGGDCVRVLGGKAEFVHCTIANLYLFGQAGHALNFANFDDYGSPLPLDISFKNSIITGFASDEVMGSRAADYPDVPFEYLFQNCLVNTPKPDDLEDHWVNCQWDVTEGDTALVQRDGNFSPAYDTKHLLFYFELSEKSKAIGTADPAITQATFPDDRKGRARGTFPDMGCYQHP